MSAQAKRPRESGRFSAFGHRSRHLFPKLSVGGLYIIEDLHTAYWPIEWEGGYGRKGTAIDLIKGLIDDLHGWYHDRGTRHASPSELASITVVDSMVIIEKGEKPRPGHLRVGRPNVRVQTDVRRGD